MEVVTTIDEVRNFRWADLKASWGLVPTMGYLHAGHLSLVRRARSENHRVGVSIFVNPVQFDNAEDLNAYPKNVERDLDLLAREDVDLVLTPSVDHVYPAGFQTFVEVLELSKGLEGASRPGHFKDVATVVCKLLNIFQPNKVYFGQKDAQQVKVVQRMVKDLNFPIEVVTCATVREPDGLAMSSRNTRLSPRARKSATCIYRALQAVKKSYEAGEGNIETLKAKMMGIFCGDHIEKADYVSVADPESLEELDRIDNKALISVAVVVDGVRLIDNIIIGCYGESNRKI